MNKEKKLKKLAQTLLATTCLTAGGAGAAAAGTVDESMVAGGFGKTFATATMLAAGTTTVTGTVCVDCGDSQDWFIIPSLSPGSIVAVTESGSPAVNFRVEDSSQDVLQTNTDVTSAVNFNVTVPLDGELVFNAIHFGENGSIDSYEVDLASSGAPEPGTFAMGGLALAAAGALRRKLKKA